VLKCKGWSEWGVLDSFLLVGCLFELVGDLDFVLEYIWMTMYTILYRYGYGFGESHVNFQVKRGRWGGVVAIGCCCC
jgi:hypothetical protein